MFHSGYLVNYVDRRLVAMLLLVWRFLLGCVEVGVGMVSMFVGLGLALFRTSWNGPTTDATISTAFSNFGNFDRSGSSGYTACCTNLLVGKNRWKEVWCGLFRTLPACFPLDCQVDRFYSSAMRSVRRLHIRLQGWYHVDCPVGTGLLWYHAGWLA